MARRIPIRYELDPVSFIDVLIRKNEKGKPWSLSPHQRRVLALAFRRSAAGSLLYSIILWSEVKKSGKTFLAACIAIKEAVTKSDSEIVCIANDEEQAVSRVFRTVCKLIEHNPGLHGQAQVLATEIRFTNGSIIRAVSSDYKGQAGGRQRVTIFDELWAFEAERMTRLFEEMTPPPTEENAYILIVSYAGYTGESRVLEDLYKRGLAGTRIHGELECYVNEGLFMFWSYTPRQPWLTEKYYAEQRRILRPNTFARLHRNEWVSSESTFITEEMWLACVDPSLRPVLMGGALFLGFDIGVKKDNAAVVGVGWNEDGTRLMVATHKVWRPTRAEPVRLGDVEAHITELAARHSVVKVVGDPWQAVQMIENLRAALGEATVEEFPQTSERTVLMGETLFTTVMNRNMVAYPSKEMQEHVTNAMGVETARGVRMVKSAGSKKIDLAVALSMALVAAIQHGKPLLGDKPIEGFGGYVRPGPDWDGEAPGAEGDSLASWIDGGFGGLGGRFDW